MKKIDLNLENKNIIITGGSGFLGSQIIDALLNERANVFIIDIQKPKKKTLHAAADVYMLNVERMHAYKGIK